MQADGRFLLEGSGTDTFLVRRVRPILDAKVFRFFELRIQADFAGSRFSLLDAYGNLHFIDEIQLRVGKGKAPVGLERLQSPADITFAERGFPTLLVPNRDVGVQLHGKLFGAALEYALGVYNGVPTGASGDEDVNNEKDVVGRVFAFPLDPLEVPVLESLGLGIAIEHGTQAGALPTHRSASQQIVFEYADTAAADGERLIVSPQAYLAVGPAALLAEYALVEERVGDGAQSSDVQSEAWQVAGSVVVYGGKPSYQGVKLENPLDPAAGTLGAFEVGARYSELRISRDAFTFADRAAAVRRASAWAAVGTWHFARRVRAQAHYERTTFRGGAATGARETEGVLIARLQVAF